MANNQALRFFKLTALPASCTAGDVYYIYNSNIPANNGLWVCKTTATSGATATDNYVRFAYSNAATSSASGVVKLSSSTSSDLETVAATSKAVKTVLGTSTDTADATTVYGAIAKAAAAQTTASAAEPATTAVRHTASTAVGSATNPVYVASDGTATACTFSLGKSVPTNAVFTDTHNSHKVTVINNDATDTAAANTSNTHVAVVTSVNSSTAASADDIAVTTTRVLVPTCKTTDSLATRIGTLETTALTGMQYKGETADVPASGKQGDVYKCTGAIPTLSAEAGDFIVCKTATNGSTAATWDVWQANVTKDAFWGSNTITDAQIVIADGTSGKIKCSGKTVSSFAAASHNHPTSNINLLTGYAKGTDASALATTDTLNAALSKLENKADNAKTIADSKWTKALATLDNATTPVQGVATYSHDNFTISSGNVSLVWADFA